MQLSIRWTRVFDPSSVDSSGIVTVDRIHLAVVNLADSDTYPTPAILWQLFASAYETHLSCYNYYTGSCFC